MAADIDWPHIALQAASSVLSAGAGLLVGVWKWGRTSALREQKLKEEMRMAIERAHAEANGRLDLLVEQFTETFAGMRRQIDDDRLRIEQTFLRKDDFRDFRDEYREDIRDIKESIKDLGKK